MVCDSYVRPATLVRLCDECNYGSLAGRCTICGGVGVSDAFYCKECTVQEKDVSLFMLYQNCKEPCKWSSAPSKHLNNSVDLWCGA